MCAWLRMLVARVQLIYIRQGEINSRYFGIQDLLMGEYHE